MSACMTIRELASELGICHSTLGHWETGRHAPPLRMLLRVADVTRADVHWILVGYGQSPKDTRDTSVGCEPLRDIDGDALDKVGGGLQLLHLCFPVPQQGRQFAWSPLVSAGQRHPQ